MLMNTLLCCVIWWLTTIGLPLWIAIVFTIFAVLDVVLRILVKCLNVVAKNN